MKFTSKLELIKYVIDLPDAVITALEVIPPPADPAVPATSASVQPVTDVTPPVPPVPMKVTIESLSDSPEMVATVTRDEVSIITVESYESVPNSCGTGMVTICGRTIYTNVCESEDGPQIYLNLNVDGNLHINAPVKMVVGSTPTIELASNLIK